MNPKTMFQREWVAVLVLLSIGFLVHGVNMFHAPYYDNDEGTYMSQAWAVVYQRTLSPYTYTYDHAPLGWILIAGWSVLTGGFYTFGSSIDSGRVFLLLIHVATIFLIYLIARRITHDRLVALLSGYFFSLSPLSIYFGRRVLLDPIMTAGVLLSLCILLRERKTFFSVLIAGSIFGVSILVKETAVVFIPLVLFVLFSERRVREWLWHSSVWVLVVLGCVSLYGMYSIARGEFYARDDPRALPDQQASLVETVLWQTGRTGGSLLDPQSNIRTVLRQWIFDDAVLPVQDPFISIFGLLCLLVVLFFRHYPKELRAIAFGTCGYLLFLGRGGQVFSFYIIPLIPLLSLFLGAVVSRVSYFFSQFFGNRVSPVGVASIVVLLFSIPLAASFTVLYVRDETSAQRDAVEWIYRHTDPNAVFFIENYAFIELRDPPARAAALPRPHAHFYWKVLDWRVRYTALDNRWQTVDYLLVSPQMLIDIHDPSLSLVRDAYDHSFLEERFANNAWWIEVRSIEQ